jgi:hypothetical protein
VPATAADVLRELKRLRTEQNIERALARKTPPTA